MEKRVDLHIHTSASDGTETPRDAVRTAGELGLAAIAITDHDTVSGVAEAQNAGAALGVEVVPGIEISADYRGAEAHILGLFIDPQAPELRPVMDRSLREREARNEKIVAAMEADGIPISAEMLKRAYPGAVLGRPHIAEMLVKQGRAASVRDAFDRYLEQGRPYYRPRERMPLAEAVACIRAAGGLAIAAHPFQYGYDETELLAYIAAARQAGCAGLEAYYSEHTPEQQEYLLTLAAEWGMAVSGGSDWHGARKEHIQMGTGVENGLFVPYGVLEALRAARSFFA